MPPHKLVENMTYGDIPGFPGYRVGDDGSVWSRWSLINQTGRFKSRLGENWKRLTPIVPRVGYQTVKLCNELGLRRCAVHRLVLEVFVGSCPVGMEGCHSDGDRTNNCLTNLRWGTPKSNGEDRKKHGRLPRGARHYSTTLSDEKVLAIRAERKSGASHKELASKYNISKSGVAQITLGINWKHLLGQPQCSGPRL